MSQRRLLMDAGNSSLKWAVVEDDQWVAQGRTSYVDWTALTSQLVPGTECFIASVTHAANAQQLVSLLDTAGIAATWLESEAEFGGVCNAYLNPKQLGVDRWMGLIAAHQRTRSPVLVVSAGTAVTVDALSADGVFLGGLIVPGVHLMQQALHKGTAGVEVKPGHWQAFPRNTADAIQSGIVMAISGAIHQQHAHLAAAAGLPSCCLVTGGNAELILPYLHMHAEHVPALVLEGIQRVARERVA